jgi:hypothetical protein
MGSTRWWRCGAGRDVFQFSAVRSGFGSDLPILKVPDGQLLESRVEILVLFRVRG